VTQITAFCIAGQLNNIEEVKNISEDGEYDGREFPRPNGSKKSEAQKFSSAKATTRV
jgi:hypothetical protein